MTLTDGQDYKPVDLYACNPDESLGMAFCTQDEGCLAEADAHLPDCPVERWLVDEFGGL